MHDAVNIAQFTFNINLHARCTEHISKYPEFKTGTEVFQTSEALIPEYPLVISAFDVLHFLFLFFKKKIRRKIPFFQLNIIDILF